MIPIKPVFVNNRKLLKELAKRGRRPGRAELERSLEFLLRRYAYAKIKRCDGSKVATLDPALSNQLASDFEHYYSRPVSGFEYIKKIRDELSPTVCPMCGSLSSGTIDHILPRALYPELSLFSLNLVPACGCNSRRINDVNVAPLHPYFDDDLNRQLVTCHISGRYDRPVIDVVAANGLEPDLTVRVRGHIKNVLKRNKIDIYLDKTWFRMVSAPQVWLGLLEQRGVDDVETALRRMSITWCQQTGTENNWVSILCCGMLSSQGVVQAIHKQLSGIPVEEIGPF
jgi:5-methylcytosine-specific restriction endonuclease McrA